MLHVFVELLATISSQHIRVNCYHCLKTSSLF